MAIHSILVGHALGYCTGYICKIAKDEAESIAWGSSVKGLECHSKGPGLCLGSFIH